MAYNEQETCACNAQAQDQAYPAKPIRVIVTVASGGETSARIAADKLAGQLGVKPSGLLRKDSASPSRFLLSQAYPGATIPV